MSRPRILKQAEQWPFRVAGPTGKRGFIAVDLQNDFVDGSLPVPGGADAANRLGKALRGEDPNFNHADYDKIVSTQDWHHDPGNHWSETPDYIDTWPVHCKAGTPGAEMHPGMKGARIDHRFFKGHDRAAYSGFEGSDGDPSIPHPTGGNMADYFRSHGITDLDVAGLATDYCVKHTAMDAAKNGFHTRVLLPYSASIAQGPDLQKALDEMKAAGIEIVQ